LAQDFDVYVHIDKKSSIKVGQVVQSPNVFVHKKFKISWGSLNIVKATLHLLSTAHEKRYDRYVLISGQAVPLHGNREITRFFASNPEQEFMSCSPLDQTGWLNAWQRITHFHFWNANGKLGFQRYLFHFLALVLGFANSLFQINRPIDLAPFGGSQWFNLTGNAVEYIVTADQADLLCRRLRATYCPDEMYFQTLLMNSHLNANIVDSSLRYIDWESGPDYPRTLDENDLPMIRESKMLFARKINSKEDSEFLDSIYNGLA
jgi:hypothetical protein